MQIIASLLRLQAKAASDEIVTALLLESQHRLEAMAMIHEQLYESVDLREVHLGRQADLLITNLLNAFGVDPARISGHVAVSNRVLTAVRWFWASIKLVPARTDPQ